jgi:hypothetical protein
MTLPIRYQPLAPQRGYSDQAIGALLDQGEIEQTALVIIGEIVGDARAEVAKRSQGPPG